MPAARTDARLVVSPWANHGTEPYDPLLVEAAVAAACDVVGKSPPAAPTAWRWRLAGLVLGMVGACALGALALRLRGLAPRWAWARGPLFSGILIGGFVLTTGTWFSVMPRLWRVPRQVAAMTITWLVVMGAGRLGIPRWSFLAFAVAAAIGSLIGGAYLLAFFLAYFALVLLPGTVLGGIAAYRGPQRDGDWVMAIMVGYAVGQLIPRILAQHQS